MTMAKRSNPFVEDYVPQSKTHVGLKQFNNNEDRMRKVYEKTLQLLFKGANKLPEHMKSSEKVFLCRKDTMKQLIINKDGTLLNSKTIDSGKIHSVQKCSCDSTAVECRCTYCEVPLCSSCSHRCVRCQLGFCCKCFFIGSEGAEICVSCYG